MKLSFLSVKNRYHDQTDKKSKQTELHQTELMIYNGNKELHDKTKTHCRIEITSDCDTLILNKYIIEQLI